MLGSLSLQYSRGLGRDADQRHHVGLCNSHTRLKTMLPNRVLLPPSGALNAQYLPCHRPFLLLCLSAVAQADPAGLVHR